MKNARCPVEVGDYFYRRNHCTDIGASIPDRLQVMEIKEDDGMFFIRAKYIYHAIGPVFERTFSDIIFRDPNWIVEKKGEKTA